MSSVKEHNQFSERSGYWEGGLNFELASWWKSESFLKLNETLK
jgi:hypothetical protein